MLGLVAGSARSTGSSGSAGSAGAMVAGPMVGAGMMGARMRVTRSVVVGTRSVVGWTRWSVMSSSSSSSHIFICTRQNHKR